MEKEDRDIFIRDLCCRIPYGVLVKYKPMSFIKGKDSEWVDIPLCSLDVVQNTFSVGDRFSETINARLFNRFGDPFIKPYLRPLSSMTEDEFNELKEYSGLIYDQLDLASFQDGAYKCLDFYLNEIPADVVILVFDWLNAHHFDYRGLIPKNLALPAPVGMY